MDINMGVAGNMRVSPEGPFGNGLRLEARLLQLVTNRPGQTLRSIVNEEGETPFAGLGWWLRAVLTIWLSLPPSLGGHHP
jgi:hypothetical protein